MRDTAEPDMTVKVTGYQWKWGYDYIKGEGERHQLHLTLATPQDQIKGEEEKGENYLLEPTTTMVVPVGKKIRIPDHCQRRHPRLVRACLRRSSRTPIPGFIRDTAFRAEKEGTLSRPVCGTVRQGPRLHADRG
jgi:cytochrome c oxidase subunit 2